MGCAQSSAQQNTKNSREANEDFIKKLSTLRKVPLLKWLPKEQHPLLAGAAENAEFEPGERVVQQGTKGSAFFIITEGEAAVWVEIDGESNQVANLKARDYFGEHNLLFDKMCNTTVCALTKLTCLTITRDKFFELGLDTHVSFPRRQAVRCTQGEDTKALSRPPNGKKPNEEQVEFIRNGLKMNKYLIATMGLTETHIKIIAEHFWLDTIPEGKQAIKQGDDKCDKFYIVASGAFDVLKQDEESDRGSEKVGCVENGGSFGEMALIYSCRQETTVQATQASDVWIMDRATFAALKREAALLDYAAVLDRIKIFSALWQQEKRTLVEALVPSIFVQDQEIIAQGDDESAFYILTEGEVAVIKTGEERGKLAASPVKVHWFGEHLLSDESKPAAATVKVISPAAKALVLGKDVIEIMKDMLDEPVKTVRGKLTQRATAFAQASKVRFTQFGKRNPNQMKLFGVLGVGGFGKVELRQDKKTGECFAVKSMSKGFIAKQQMQQNVVNELQVLLSVSSPFIIELHGTNKNKQWIFFFMEAALGGDLRAAYRKQKLYGEAETAKYYIACVALALDHLHERYVIYRDLKPENLLLDGKGNMKLTDMGLAKFTLGKTYTFCGTSEYFAPEVIQYQGQTRALDWWTLGILSYELMTGSPPFEGKDDAEIFASIIRGIERIHVQPSLGEMKSLVTSLLKNDPGERLPMKPGGVKNLRGHPTFSKFDWVGLECGRLTPPYVPNINGPADFTDFKKKYRGPTFEDYIDDGSEWDADF